MNSLKSRLLVTLLVLLAAAPAAALEIISPADNTIVADTTRLVIKGGDQPPIEAITIAVNGEKSDLLDISSAAYRQSFQDFVFLEVVYDPGVNRIEVEGYAGGKRVAETKVKVYFPQGVIEPPAPFAVKFFHTPEREALCTGCHHNLEPSAKDLANPVPGQNPCSTCHGAIINGKLVHGPAGVYDCTVCHDPKSAPAKYALADRDGRFCGECHDDVVDAARKSPFVHGPVASGLCLACHDPHASDAFGLVRGATLNASCGSCHPAVAEQKIHGIRTVTGASHPLEGKKDPARPGAPFTCASCHEPHAAETASYLRGGKVSGFNFCKLCHVK